MEWAQEVSKITLSKNLQFLLSFLFCSAICAIATKNDKTIFLSDNIIGTSGNKTTVVLYRKLEVMDCEPLK